MKIIFCDLNTQLCENVKFVCKSFGIEDQVIIHNNEFQELKKFDAIVAAGNSFGIMSGGIDLHIQRFFDVQRINVEKCLDEDGKLISIENLVQSKIKDEYLGELPVGSSMMINTEIEDYPFIVYSPTMRAPMALPRENNNVYNATLSAVIAIIQHNKNNEKKIETVVFSGMGTGTGFYPLDLSALQMSFSFIKLLGRYDEKRNVVLGKEIEVNSKLGLTDMDHIYN